MKADFEKIKIMNEWRNGKVGVFTDANNELQVIRQGQFLLLECYHLFSQLETLPSFEKVGFENGGFPVIFHDFRQPVDGLRWRIYLSVARAKACILMFKPFGTIEEKTEMHAQSSLRARRWVECCDRDCGHPRPPVPATVFLSTARTGQNPSSNITTSREND